MLKLLGQDPNWLHRERGARRAPRRCRPRGSSGRVAGQSGDRIGQRRRDRRRPHRPRPPRRRVTARAERIEHRCEHRVGIVRLGGNRTCARPVKLGVALGDELDLLLLHAAEARQELGRDLRRRARDRRSSPTSRCRSPRPRALPANARRRRTRHATSAPVAPEYVCASSSTMNDSGAPVNSSKSCWRVISSSSWFAFVIRMRGLRSRISCSLAHSSNGTTSRSFALRLRLPPSSASRPSPSSRCVDVAVRRSARRRPDVHPVGDARAGEQQPQAVALVGRERVHRVDEHRDDAVGLVRVAHPQAAVDDRVQERLGLAGAGPGRDEHVLAAESGTQRLLLMGEERRELGDARRAPDE